MSDTQHSLQPIRIGIVAGEPSGDILAAGLLQQIKIQHPDAIIEGIGGPLMLEQGCHSLFDMEELSVAMKNVGVNVMDDELSRMIEECDVHGRLWTITAYNHLGQCNYILKIIVVEGASELGYSSTDVFCGIRQKFPPLKIAHLRGARPFKFSVDPPLPQGMEIDEDTGWLY